MSPVIRGSLKERPLPRLLQQLYRKKFTGHFVISDQTQDESEVYLREGALVHVRRPVDTDRLDNLLVEFGVVPAEIVAQAAARLGEGRRLGDVLERMGALDKQKLAQVLKAQVVRKLSRLFFVTEGTYAVYDSSHIYGEGADLSLMRVDPRSVIYSGIRSAYNLPRVTRELAYLLGQRFRLAEISPGFVAAMGIAAEDTTIAALRENWMTLDDVDSITSRPFEVRVTILALYYSDVLVCGPAGSSAVETAISATGSGRVQVPMPAPPVPAVSRPTPAPPTLSRPTPAPPTLSRPMPAPPASAVRVERASASLDSSSPVPRAPYPPAAPQTAASPAARPPRSGPTAAADEATRATILDMDKKLGKLTHFELLGVNQNASSDEVSTAFLRAARQFHPDRLAGGRLQDLQPAAERILARINEAAMVLGNPARRSEYVTSMAMGFKNSQTSLPTVLEGENQFIQGEAHLKKGEYAKAIAFFTAAVQGNPSEPQYRAYLAWSRFEDPMARKDSLATETLHTLETVLKDRPKFARGYYWLGLVWKFLNESDRAAQAFRMASAIDTSLIDASRELRLIEMRKQKAPAKPDSSPGGGWGKFFKR